MASGQEKVLKEEPCDESHEAETEQDVVMSDLKPADEPYKESALGVHETVLHKAPKPLPKEEAVEVDEAPNLESRDVQKEPENEKFFDVTPVVKVEHGQGVEVEDYSTWTQDNYLDYYGYADEETGKLFLFEPGEVDADVTTPQEIHFFLT